MFDYIKGNITYFGEGKLTIENKSGIGFLINVSNTTITDFMGETEDVKIYIYTSVREDDISLFGFSSLFERDVFLHLIDVPKVGAKTAQNILGTLSPNSIVEAVLRKDDTLLCSAKGIGKKAAQQIIVTLSDKFSKINLGNTSEILPSNNELDEDMCEEAILALTSLGFDRSYSSKIVRELSIDDDLSVEDIIKIALQKVNE